MLAKIGRGFSDVVVYREHIFHKVEHLLKMASIPVLTDIKITFKGDNIKLYPEPIPDLFVHSPIVAAARYTIKGKNKEQPTEVIVSGTNPKSKTEEFIAKIVETPHLPVHKIFVKQQIDLLTADAWAQEKDAIKKQVIQLSCDHCLPSQYTSLVSFETSRAQMRNVLGDEHTEGRDDNVYSEDVEYDEKDEEDEEEDDDDNESGDENDSENSKKKKKKKKDKKKKKSEQKKSNVKSTTWAKIKNNPGTVAALVGGGAIAVIAVTAASFGDVQSTFDNIPVLDGGFGLDGVTDACCGDDCDCDCDCDGDCDADCGECVVM